MKVINFWGGPSSGKSTTAAGLFHDMSLQLYKVELVHEYAKLLTWSGCTQLLEDQALIFGNQNHLLWQLRDKVDYAITDSPLPLSIIHMPQDYPPSFATFATEMFKSYENINIFMRRVKPYDPNGRNEDEAGADKIAREVYNFLALNSIPFIEVNGNKDAVESVFEFIMLLEKSSCWYEAYFRWLHQLYAYT